MVKWQGASCHVLPLHILVIVFAVFLCARFVPRCVYVTSSFRLPFIGGGQKRKSAALHFFGGHSQSEGHLSGPPNWFHTRPSSGEHTLWRFAILMPPGCCGNCLFRASTSVSISYSTSTWLSKTKFLLTTG